MDLSALIHRSPAALPTQQNATRARTAAAAVATQVDPVGGTVDEGDQEDDIYQEWVASDTASSAPSDLSTSEFSAGLKRDLQTALDSIQSRATFAAVGRIPDLRPDLFVNDVGTISLPLSEAQARQIVDKARKGMAKKPSLDWMPCIVRNANPPNLQPLMEERPT